MMNTYKDGLPSKFNEAIGRHFPDGKVSVKETVTAAVAIICGYGDDAPLKLRNQLFDALVEHISDAWKLNTASEPEPNAVNKKTIDEEGFLPPVQTIDCNSVIQVSNEGGSFDIPVLRKGNFVRVSFVVPTIIRENIHKNELNCLSVVVEADELKSISAKLSGVKLIPG